MDRGTFTADQLGATAPGRSKLDARVRAVLQRIDAALWNPKPTWPSTSIRGTKVSNPRSSFRGSRYMALNFDKVGPAGGRGWIPWKLPGNGKQGTMVRWKMSYLSVGFWICEQRNEEWTVPSFARPAGDVS